MNHCHTNHTKKKVFTQADLDFARKVFPGLRSIAGHNLVDPATLSAPDAYYMTILREPVARAISHYQDSVVRGDNRKSFEDSLKERDRFENLQVKLIAGERNVDKAKFFLEKKCEFVGLTEQFELSLHVLDRIGPFKFDLNYKRKIVAKDNSIKKSIEADPRMMELAREFNALDLELYSFAVREIFPRLCEKAGLKPSEKVSSFDNYTSELRPRYVLGRVYNKMFRQIYKFAR